MAEATQPASAVGRRARTPLWKWLCGAGVAAVLVTSVLAGLLWFTETGSGEVRRSPDGRFDAHANNMSRGTLWGTREEWVDIRVTEQATGREVWRVRRNPAPGTAPDYGMRGARSVEWAADSSAVTVDIDGGQKLTFPVP
jgi:hypothetical protein